MLMVDVVVFAHDVVFVASMLIVCCLLGVCSLFVIGDVCLSF